MSDNQNFGFGQFVPGFDFLQNLAKGASQTLPQMPNLSNWVAPTLNLEELDKRIGELKAVHFWLDQNSKALAATIQALEVQKMTLATLKGMNFNMGELTEALKFKVPEPMDSAAGKSGGLGKARAVDKAADTDKAVSGAQTRARAAPKAGDGKAAAAAGGVVDPMQWWGALTEQFQHIAAAAMKDAAGQAGVDTSRSMAAGATRQAMKAATGMAKAASGTLSGAAPKAAPKRPAAKRVASKSRR